MNSNRLQKLLFISLVAGSTLLSGCAAVVVGGAAVSAVTVTEDKRTLGTQIDDSTTESRISSAIAKVPNVKDVANVNLHVYNGVALLMGQARDHSIRNAIAKAAATVPHVTQIHNQIRIGEPIPTSTEAHDVWLASKVRTQLLADKQVDFLKIDVSVEDSEVFLMGLVTQEQASKAIDIARNVSGVVKVVNVFEVL